MSNQIMSIGQHGDSIVFVEPVNPESLQRINNVLAGFGNGEMAFKAARSALARSAATAKTKAGQFAAAHYTINKGTFMGNTRVRTRLGGDSAGVTSVNITFAGAVLPLITFSTRFSKGGLSVTVKKGQGGNLVNAFIIQRRNNNIFERLGDERYPVEKKYGPSTAHMMQNDQVVEQMEKTIYDTFEKRFEHEITRVLNGWGG